MQPIFTIIFIFTIILCLSSYVFYPLIIGFIGSVYPFCVKKENVLPFVSVIIPAYNEAKHIEKKILNTLALNYPGKKIEIIVGSDGSTDDTAKIVEKYSSKGIRFIGYETNRGKTAVQNDLVNKSRGEILVFTDAASFLPPEAVKKIVCNFADQRIGCVAGKMQFINTDENMTTQSQGLYWKYEVLIRELESRVGSLIGVDGPLYAVRREYYIPLGHHVISDLMIPILILAQGKKVVLEPEAIVNEAPTIKSKQEFKTRRRITLRGLIGISTYKHLLNPIKHPVISFQIFLHKIIRWFIGVLVVLNGVSALVLCEAWPFQIYLVCYVLFFVAALFGWGLSLTGIKIKAFTVPYYFFLVYSAATMGIIDYIGKRQAVTWKPVRR